MIGTGVKNQFLSKSPSSGAMPDSAFNFTQHVETLLQPLGTGSGHADSAVFRESLTETSSQSVVVAVDRIVPQINESVKLYNHREGPYLGLPLVAFKTLC